MWKNNVCVWQGQGGRMRGKREKAAELMVVASDNETFVWAKTFFSLQSGLVSTACMKSRINTEEMQLWRFHYWRRQSPSPTPTRTFLTGSGKHQLSTVSSPLASLDKFNVWVCVFIIKKGQTHKHTKSLVFCLPMVILDYNFWFHFPCSTCLHLGAIKTSRCSVGSDPFPFHFSLLANCRSWNQQKLLLAGRGE